MLSERAVDVVLMDINLPGISRHRGNEADPGCRPDTRVILLSTYGVEDVPKEAGDCGASRYANKEDFEPSVLTDTWDAREHVG